MPVFIDRWATSRFASQGADQSSRQQWLQLLFGAQNKVNRPSDSRAMLQYFDLIRRSPTSRPEYSLDHVSRQCKPGDAGATTCLIQALNSFPQKWHSHRSPARSSKYFKYQSEPFLSKCPLPDSPIQTSISERSFVPPVKPKDVAGNHGMWKRMVYNRLDLVKHR